jgi:periodic tryptophan protein 2
MGKRLKTGDKPNEYVPVEEDTQLYTELENKITQGRFLLEKKTKINLSQPGVKVVSCEFSPAVVQTGQQTRIMVIGQNNGVFGVFNVDTLESIHSFQISDSKIDSISINSTGEWIALASKQQGQLFVWEWKSETYVLKQQGHFFDLNTVAYSNDGSFIATGGDDGKVKLWTTKNFLSFVTFSEHTAQITDLKFVPKKNNTLISASLDGTVRAYDLVKYRNFRVLEANKPTQFNSLAVDSSGDIIVAGSMDPFNIYVWSLRTGQLMDILNGHTGPISSLVFS